MSAKRVGRTRAMTSIQKITPFLWFDRSAEEAARFYVSVFGDGKLLKVLRYAEGGPAPAGAVMTVDFELFGQRFTALNGGPRFTFNEAVSFVVRCTTQRELDRIWARLTADGGQPSRCGWLTDKFGVSWQIVPTVLFELFDTADGARAGRVMRAMLEMEKMEIRALRQAAAGTTRGARRAKTVRA